MYPKTQTVLSRLLVASVALLVAACGGKSKATADAGPDTVVDWHEPDLAYRALVTLQPHPDRDRVDVPVLVRLSHEGEHIHRVVRIHELASSGSALVSGGAWNQPDGTVLEVGFTAEGTTPAGETREFMVYYELASAPAVWSFGEPGWCTFGMLDDDANGEPDGFELYTDGVAIRREIRESDTTLRRYRDEDGDPTLSLPGVGWTVAEGFSNAYQLETHTETFDTQNVEDGPYTRIDTDADDFSGAVAVVWEGRSVPVLHDVLLTYRVFSQWPLVELVVSATVAENPDETRFSSASYTGRSVYLADGYDRMVSDNRGEEALDKVWDTSMRWLVVYDSATDRGFGYFLTARGVVRATDDGGEVSVYDSYGYSAGGTSYRYLWMASESKDEIVDLFDAMLPGVILGPPEHRDLNIVSPRNDDFFFPEDTLEVTVTTPGSTEPVTAALILPDQSTLAVELERTTDPHRWRSVEPLLLTSTHPVGRWTLTAESAARDTQVGFDFRLPTHPHLLFDAADLPALQARKDDPAYTEIWAEMLDQADSYSEPIAEPGEGIDIRSYADRLINLALIQLMDPSQPFDVALLDYFFAMLRYPNWDPEAAPFNNHDLTVGHFLTALALFYDWHYNRLTPAERREVREHLDTVTEQWLTTSYLRIFRDIEWPRYGTVTNNHYWINHQGVAAAAFVLAGEIPEERRSLWVDHIEENLGIILSVLEPDGTSNEGVAYHSYGQINLFRWLDMRDRALGESTAPSNPWFAESVLWDLYSTLPGGDDNYGGVANFGDCPPRHYQPPRTISAWLAARLGDGYAQWVAQSLQYPRLTAMSYLWYDPSIAATSPDGLPSWRMFPNKGIFAWRSSWANDASYLSLKSGSYFGGHEQPDAGHFILHRAGVPYVTDHGYSYWKVADEHNLVLIGDAGQHGGESQWMSAVDPAHWAHAEAVLADPLYFDLLADPGPMVDAEELSGWTREVVGLGPDLFFVRDVVDATASVPIHWLLHSYRSDPPTSENHTYGYVDRRLENPFTEVDATHWVINPQDTAPVLHVADVSPDAWQALVEPSFYVPEQDLDTGEYNSALDSFGVGYRLHRTLTGLSARSVVALWWGDDLAVESWSTAQAEAARVTDTGVDVAVIMWPVNGSVSGFNGYDVDGTMAGRRMDEPAYFGRALTLLASAATVLAQATLPVEVFARLEHPATAAEPTFALVRASASTTLTLLCPTEPTVVLLDGTPTTFSWSTSLLTVDIPAGTHRLDAQ